MCWQKCSELWLTTSARSATTTGQRILTLTFCPRSYMCVFASLEMNQFKSSSRDHTVLRVFCILMQPPWMERKPAYACTTSLINMFSLFSWILKVDFKALFDCRNCRFLWWKQWQRRIHDWRDVLTAVAQSLRCELNGWTSKMKVAASVRSKVTRTFLECLLRASSPSVLQECLPGLSCTSVFQVCLSGGSCWRVSCNRSLRYWECKPCWLSGAGCLALDRSDLDKFHFVNDHESCSAFRSHFAIHG